MSQAREKSVEVGTGSVTSYTVGFVLSVVLTVIPFALVMSGALSHSATVFCVFAAAIVQIVVQLHYFLHLDTSSGMHWNVLSLVFTFLIMTLFIGGSIWVMYSLHHRM